MTPITPKLFAEAGRALFGEEWQNATAALLEMNARTVRRIAAAARDSQDYPVNPALGAVLADHLEAAAARDRVRADEAEALARLLR